MTIINNASPGSQINLMCLIYRYLKRSNNAKKKDEIINDCRPETLFKGETQEKRLPDELRFWSQVGHKLWDIDDDGFVKLINPIEFLNPTPLQISVKVRDVLLQNKIEDVLVKKREGKYDIEDLIRPLSCLLISGQYIPPYSEKLLDKSEISLFISKYLDSNDHLPNDSETPTLLEYCHFLGFLEKVKDGYVVDPTRCVKESLSSIFDDKNKIAIREFLKRLGMKIPVLDSGDYQNQVYDLMEKNGFKHRNSNEISPSLSHSIRRLEISKIIKVTFDSDDEYAMTLQLPNNEKKSISTIELIG